MPAKLDTTRPLRLIGIQIYEGTHENVRKVLSPGWYPFIKCKNSDGKLGFQGILDKYKFFQNIGKGVLLDESHYKF